MHTGSLILALIGFSHTTNCLLQEASPEPSKPVRLEDCSRSSLARDHQEYAIIACCTEITRAIRVTQTELRSATFLISTGRHPETRITWKNVYASSPAV